MAYHSENGLEFVGLRVPRNGQQQIVYDAGRGARVVVTIEDTAVSTQTIDDALQEGIHAHRVLSGVLNALKARNIRFELSS